MDRQTEKQKGRLTDKQTNDKRLTRQAKAEIPFNNNNKNYEI